MSALFDKRFSRLRAVFLGGSLLAAALRFFALGLAVALGGLLLDAVFAFDERTRTGMGGAFLLGAAVLAGFGWTTLLSTSRRAVACWIDGRLASRRRPVLSALELAETPSANASSAFGSFLLERALEQGCQAMASLPAWKWLPLRILRRDALRFLAAVAVWTLLFAVWTVPMRTHALRLLLPARDVPPWSRISFALEPENPSVVYGDSIEIAATVEGPVGSEPILFEIRDGQHVYRSAGFRESANRYVHRLERVVQPLRFCVRAGRARSRWHDLSVLYQPRIASARVSLSPPPYSGLPPRQFYLGGQKLAGLRGSRVVLDVSANRPLRRGSIRFVHPDGAETQIEGRAPGDQSIQFEWTIDGNASATIHVQDSLGTPNAGSHAFSQELLPDEPPSVALQEPPRYSLATPASLVPVDALAEDALGLRSVAIVRNLVGYRDRALPVGIAAGARQARVADALDLRSLGAQPGDAIELYVEASDSNPSLLGSSMSDVCRIDVISNDEYAEILRMRTAVEEFGERYEIISRQLDQLREALRKLSDPENENAEAAQQALDAWSQLDESYQRLAADFAIYDAEKQLPRVLDEIRSLSAPHADRLKTLPDSPSGASEIAAQWLDSIGDAAAQLDQQSEDAKLADQLMQVARAALQLQEVVDRQASLVRALERYEANLRAVPPHVLAEFAEDQAALAERLESWLADTAALADALPPDQATLADEMRQMLSAVRACNAHDHMLRASEAARNENAPDAFRLAREALDALRSACSQCENSGNGFAAMCRNPGQGFRVKPGLCDTVSQLCQALARQFGSKNGSGGIGMGGEGFAGGNPNSGYWMAGSSALNVPLHGPARSHLQSPSGRGRGHGGSGSAASGSVRSAERIDRQSAETTDTRAVSLDEIPERYREPARLFYRIDAAPESPPPHD